MKGDHFASCAPVGPFLTLPVTNTRTLRVGFFLMLARVASAKKVVSDRIQEMG